MADDIKKWLEDLGLGKYAEVFSKNEIGFRALPHLSEEDLKELRLPLGARRLLQAAVEKLPGDMAQAIQPAREETAIPRGAERRQLNVMFCDLVGSTELTQKLDPEDLREINRIYQDTCRAAIERYEGYVARYMGDGVLAYFGYPQAHEDDAERAVHAGLQVVDSMSELNETLGASRRVSLGVRVGIATGLVVVGDLIGEGASQEKAVVGETPNLAARLQAMADANSIVISEATRDLASGRFKYENLGCRKIKGIEEPVQTWRVLSANAVESRFEARYRSGVTPLVGREHEIGLILERWEHAKQGDGQVVLLSGEPGIGKSRISQIVREQTEADGHVRLRYQSSAYHSNSVLHPVTEQLTRAAQFDSKDSLEAKLQKLESLVGQATQEVDAVAPLLASLLSISTGDRYPPLEMSPEQQKVALLEALTSQLEGLSRRGPVLFVFEDVHWADPTSLELLGLVISRIQALPVLVVVTFRPEFSPPWGSHSHITSLTLSRFSRSQAVTMIENIAARRELPDEIRDHIVENADGVPLFIEELTRTVIESGMMKGDRNHYSPGGPLRTLAIPSTLHDSLMARLDRSASVREVAQIAAVIGREFSHDLLSMVSELAPDELGDALAQLEGAGLVFRYGSAANGRYYFKHALVQNAAYESLLKVKRRDLHARISQVLETDFPGKAELEPELLAHHYSEAGLVESAIPYWLKAGEHAIRQCAHAEAIAHLTRGLDMVKSLTDETNRAREEIAFRVALGVPLIGKEGAASEIVAKNYRRAQALCEQTGKNEQLYPILWGLWFHHFFRSKLREACELADELLELGRSRKDPDLRLEAHHCQWASRFVIGDFNGAMEHCNQGIELYRPELHHVLASTYGGHDPGVCARNVSGLTLWLLGFPEKSRKRFESALNLARQLGHSATLADALQMIVEVTSLEEDEETMERQAQDLLDFAKAEKMFDNETLANGLLGWVKFQRGDAQAGLELMKTSAALWLEQGTAWTAVPISLVAKALGEVGETTDALSLLDQTLSLGQRDQVHWSEAELYRVKGELLYGIPGSTSAAEDSFMQAIDISRAQNAKSLELRAVVSLARLLQTRGETGRARELLERIYSRFTEGFDRSDLRQAQALLKEL